MARIIHRLRADEAPLRWVGNGLAEFGIEPGSVFGPGDGKVARLLADGRDPSTRDRLVDPQQRMHPKAKLAAGPFAAAIEAAAADRGITVTELFANRTLQAARYARLERGIAKKGAGAHRVAVRDLARMARAVHVGLDGVYDPEALALARKYANAKVVTGLRGYDVTLNVSKSFSVLYALAGDELASRLQLAYDQVVDEAVAAVDAWAGYGQRGHQGNGRLATRVEATGLLGWSMMGYAALPVGDHVGDPHVRAHVVILNMVRGTDGRWSTVGAGGRDIMRHVPAIGAFTRARLREITCKRFGVVWSRDPRTDEWEIDGIDADVRTCFSKRQSQIRQQLGDRPATWAQQRAAAETTSWSRQKQIRNLPVADLRTDWRDQAVQAGYDVDALVAEAAPGGREINRDEVDVAVLLARVFDPSSGVTARRKWVSRADVLAEVADHVPSLASREQLEDITERVLAQGMAAHLCEAAGGSHFTHADRYRGLSCNGTGFGGKPSTPGRSG